MVEAESAHRDWGMELRSCDSVSLSASKRLEPITSKPREEAFKVAIDSFFDYVDYKSSLVSYYEAYKETSSSASIPSHIRAILAELENESGTNQERRTMLTRSLIYVALGQYADTVSNMNEIRYIRLMLDNCLLLAQSNVMDVVFHILKKFVQTESMDQDGSSLTLLAECVTLLYLITASCYYSLESINTSLLKEIAIFLINVASTRKTAFTASFINKTLLLLHITLTALLGNTENAKSIKNEVRSLYGLRSSDHGKPLKTSPADLYDFNDQIKDKFTLYQPPPYPLGISSPCVVKANKELNDIMGITTTPDDLLYRTRFPAKHQVDATKKPLPATIEFKKELEKAQSTTAFASGTPDSIKEAGDLILSNMYLSLGDYQIIREREYAVAYRTYQGGQGTLPDDTEDYSAENRYLTIIDTFYARILKELPQFVVVILNTLVATAYPPSHSTEGDMNASCTYATIQRNRQTTRSTIASLLLLMLKWFKVSHVMKYEYLSQLLVDSGYILLALRGFVMEDIKTTVYQRLDNDAYGFFNHVATAYGDHEKTRSSYISLSDSWETSIPKAFGVGADDQKYTNERNMTWMLSTLRILWMLTKGKTCRIKMMIFYKAWVPLKRIAKTYRNSSFELYALKLIKSQVAHLGMKWRSANMWVISAISRRCTSRLREDWLSTREFEEEDDDQDMIHELNLRTLIKLYNGRKYMPDLLMNLTEQQQQRPSLDQGGAMLSNTDEQISADNSDGDGWGSITANCTANRWGIDMGNSDVDQWNIDTSLVGASARPITSENLVKAVNHLYHTTMKKPRSKDEVVGDVNGWDTPFQMLPKKKTTEWSASNNQSDDDEDDDYNDCGNQKKEDDPLKGIDWENLTEEEMNERLTMVEAQTEQRWLNIDINDPAYCKVLFDIDIANDPTEDDAGDPWM